MKNLLKNFGLAVGCILSVNALAQNSPGLTFKISNPQDAKALYEIMTRVQEEGAAGHTYRKGKSILCWRVNADIDDAQGKPIPYENPRRYHCSMHINSDGLAEPGDSF